MNLYVGIGKIADLKLNGRTLRFMLDVQQEKPCKVPCIIFDPNDEVKAYITGLEKTSQLIWLQGKLSNFAFEQNGKTIRRIDIITYPNSIKIL